MRGGDSGKRDAGIGRDCGKKECRKGGGGWQDRGGWGVGGRGGGRGKTVRKGVLGVELKRYTISVCGSKASCNQLLWK